VGLVAQPSAPSQPPAATATPPPPPFLLLRVPPTLSPGEQAYLTISYIHVGDAPATLALALPAGVRVTGYDASSGACTLDPPACVVSPGDGGPVTIIVFIQADQLCGGWRLFEVTAAIGGVVVARSAALVELLAPACTWLPLMIRNT
jgi:hypothetical protein